MKPAAAAIFLLLPLAGCVSYHSRERIVVAEFESPGGPNQRVRPWGVG